MKITILGTGCIWTKRACASYLIDDNILVDAGSGTVKQLFKTSKTLLHHEKIEKIKLILITHFHLDHYFDMATLMWKIASKKRPELRATIICPPGGKEKIMQLCKLGMSSTTYAKLDFDENITFVDASTMGTFKYGEYEITSKKMDHGDIDCYGYIFKDKNGDSVAFSGDSCMCDSMKYMIDNCHVAFIDMAGTDISNKHYNIIDGIELMKQYKDKCNIVPCHLTSQAMDYCANRIEIPTDLMVLDTSNKMPYDYNLKKNPSIEKKEQFDFAEKKFERIKGKMVDLVLLRTELNEENTFPTYVFDVVVPQTNEIIGKMTYGVSREKEEMHTWNVEIDLQEDVDFKSIKYDCCNLIKVVAKYHKANKLYLTCEPGDRDTRRVFNSLGAFLKEIKTFTYFDEDKNRRTMEKCIWVWELEKNGK